MSSYDLGTIAVGSAAPQLSVDLVRVGEAMLSAEEARQIVKNINGRFEQSRKDLIELHDREGWKALDYDNWRDCVQAEFQQSAAYLYRQLAAAKIEQLIESPIGEMPESHLRPLTKFNSQTTIKKALDRADEIRGDQPRTAKHITQAANEMSKPLSMEQAFPLRLRKRATALGARVGSSFDIAQQRALIELPDNTAWLSADELSTWCDTAAVAETTAPDLPIEFAVIQRRYEQHDHTLSVAWDGTTQRFVVRKNGGTGAVMLWPAVLDRLERLDDQAEYDADHPAQVAARIPPALDPAPAGDPLPAKLIALALADLDAILPADLFNAGYFWHSAMPPTIGHNEGNWRGDAPTPAQALTQAYDREKAKVTKDRRLPAPIYVRVMDLIGKLRQAVVDAEHGHAAKLARAIAILIEQETTP